MRIQVRYMTNLFHAFVNFVSNSSALRASVRQLRCLTRLTSGYLAPHPAGAPTQICSTSFRKLQILASRQTV